MEKSEQIIRLVKTLTKGEKRNFKILASKIGRKDKNYVVLFDWIEKKGSLDIPAFLKKNPSIKKSQLPNLKNNLFKQILRSIREISKESYEEIKTREYFDFAKILYSKGDYASALNYLEKAKKLGARIKKSTLIYLATDFEKQIESQHITGSMNKKALYLAEYSTALITDIQLTNELSNLSLLLYGRYLKKGFTRNQVEEDNLSEFFYDNLPSFHLEELGFEQKLYLYESYVWFHYMQSNYAENFKYALKWFRLFEEYPEMKDIDKTHYLRAIHNVLTALFSANKSQKFLSYFDKLLAIESNEKLQWVANETAMFELFKLIHSINKIFLFVEYDEVEKDLNSYKELLEKNPYNWDISRLVVFYYKIACVYFGRAEYDKSLYWLNKIINENLKDTKEDIQCYARILSLITHYELGNQLHITYQIISTFRFLLKMRQLGLVQSAIFNFLRRSVKFDRNNMEVEFQKLKDQLEEIMENVFERRSFLYLDLLSWLDSRIKHIPMVEAIRMNLTTTEIARSK